MRIAFSFFFFNDTATTEIYTLSLHDALPIFMIVEAMTARRTSAMPSMVAVFGSLPMRSEEHTSELQSPCNLVCRLLLEKKKTPHTVEHPFGPPARHPHDPHVPPVTCYDLDTR